MNRQAPPISLKKGPLDGIMVLDFSRVLAGPYCTMVLADLGARVIKIEKLGTGDDTRAFGPFIEHDGASESAYFMCFNRAKQSIALDLKTPRASALRRPRPPASSPAWCLRPICCRPRLKPPTPSPATTCPRFAWPRSP